MRRTMKEKTDPPPRRRTDSRLVVIAGLTIVVAVLVGLVALAVQRMPSAPLETVTINGQPFKVEIAATEQKQRQGLMFRKKLPPRTGMLFVFDRPEIRYFWMRNTYIPLDIIFIDADRKIINIATMPPLTDDHCQSDRPARFVLELEAGSAKRYKLHPGQTVEMTLP